MSVYVRIPVYIHIAVVDYRQLAASINVFCSTQLRHFILWNILDTLNLNEA